MQRMQLMQSMKADRNPYKVEMLPESDDAISEERESGMTHSPFYLDVVLYSAIRNGDTEGVIQSINDYLGKGLVIGRMSMSAERQMKYWAVAAIAVAIHYAILGGLDETDAYNLSDEYIRTIDRIKDMEDCISYLKEKALELTEAVADCGKRKYSGQISTVVHYIHVHLHEKLDVKSLAACCSLSPGRLSVRFKKETGKGIHEYVLEQKLKASVSMLAEGKKLSEICYQLGFCSESHFIELFRRQYGGRTPGAYRNSI